MALLAADAGGATLLDRSLAEVAHGVLAPDVLPHTAVGPYRLLRVLGEGGMGVVYLAERADLGSRSAIKLLRDAWLSPARRDRFASEQRTLASLNHPAIAQLYDADSLPDGTPWFAMEYVEGQPLTEFCEARGTSITARLRLFRAACEAVQYAHGHAVIHRDLKPSNILVTGDGRVKLLDFGIARQLEPLGAHHPTQTGLRMLTPAYAAPEQFRGGRIGIHTDVYALGVTLYQLLTGRLPFDLSGLASGEAERVVSEQEPARPSAVARQLQDAGAPLASSRGLPGTAWADLDVLCLTAMHKDPQRRYATVDALIRDIDHYLEGEPLQARPDSLQYRMSKFVRRNRKPVIVAGIVGLALVALVVFYTIRLTAARNTAEAEAARTGRIQRFMQTLFEGGDDAVGPADSLRVITLVDRGVQEARALDGEPAVQAELYQTLGGIYQKLGNLPRADSLLQASLAQRRTLFGADHPDVAASLTALGLLRLEQAELPEAERLTREGLAMIRRQRGANPDAVAAAAKALGQVLTEQGAYDSATTILGEATRQYRTAAAGTPTPELAGSYFELANAHFHAGRYDLSDSLNREALAMHRQLYGNNHPLVAEDLINLGAAQFDRGNYPAAEDLDRQALAISRAWYGEDHYKTASHLTMLGRALVFQRKDAEAEATLQQSLAIAERVYGPVHPRVASAVNELSSLALQQNRLDVAAAGFQRMVEIYREVYHDRHYLIGTATSNLASVYMSKGENVRAEGLFRDAIRRFQETMPADHLYVGIARIKLGRSLLRQKRFADAAESTLMGYDILSRQASPSVSFLMAARKDLAAAYDSLGLPERSARFHQELADTAKSR